MPVRKSVLAKQFLVLAALAATVFCARPAAAQISIGSPDGPPRVELGVGAFDITPSNRRNAGVQGDFRGEYHFGDIWCPYFSPFIGTDITTTGGTYTFGGFGFDVNLAPNWVVTPNGAV